MAADARCFFILSTARSGSTSLASILDGAANGQCAVEPEPNLNREMRWMMDGRLDDPMTMLREKIVPRVRTGMQACEVYGEKNPTYGPFISHLSELLDCRFVLLQRDLRDIVRSLMDWHEQAFGTIYRECADSGRLSPVAVRAAANLPVHLDYSDYSRPRPRAGDPLFCEWEQLRREEMCAYYVARLTDLQLDELSRIPDDKWTQIDYTRPRADDVLRVADFLGLRGLSESTVAEQLDRRVNSLSERFGRPDRFPHWTDWDSGARDRFERLAGGAMRRCGYFGDVQADWKPENFGRFWQQHEGGSEWYEWMYDSRLKMHEEFVTWVRHSDRTESIASIADFGCGRGVGYRDHFADRRYVGADLSQQNIDWCQKNAGNGHHEYHWLDFVAEPLPEKYDVVFSSGTIDNSYDMDAFLRAMVRASRRWIYLTCYRGWFPELSEHVYRFDREHACFYNDLSPRRAARVLREAGCRDIVIEPVSTGRTDILDETRIIAHVGDAN